MIFSAGGGICCTNFSPWPPARRFIISCNVKPALEYDYYTLCVRHPVPFTRPRVTFQSTYPRAWMSHYQAENYFAIDPVLRPENFMRGHLPWNDSLFRDAPALWDGARDHGLQRA